jgi:hypothetical protein
MTRERAMDAHGLEPIKGWGPDSLGCVTKALPLSANVTIDPVYEGRVVHINSELEWEMGCVGYQMAGFLFGSSDDPDTGGEGDTDDQPIRGASGVLVAIMAKAAVELASTEFDGDQTYAPNEPLRAIASNSDATTGGRLTNQGVTKAESATPQSATAICAIVSEGEKTNYNNRTVLCFWPVFKPGAGTS